MDVRIIQEKNSTINYKFKNLNNFEIFNLIYCKKFNKIYYFK